MELHIKRSGPDSLGNESVVFMLFPDSMRYIAEKLFYEWRADKRGKMLENLCVQFHVLTRFFDTKEKRWRYVSKCEGYYDTTLDPDCKKMAEFAHAYETEMKRLRYEEPKCREPFNRKAEEDRREQERLQQRE